MRRIIFAIAIALAVSAHAQEGLVETHVLVPLGVNPSIDIQERIAAAPPCATVGDQGCRENVTLAAFRIDTWFPFAIAKHFPGGEAWILRRS